MFRAAVWEHKVSAQMAFASDSISKICGDNGNLKTVFFLSFFVTESERIKFILYCQMKAGIAFSLFLHLSFVLKIG